MPTQTQREVLERMIESSVLLSEERRGALRKVLPTLKPKQRRELHAILSSEHQILQEIAKCAIERAVAEGDEAFLQELDAFLKHSLKKLRRAEEKAERGEEQENVESLFDETP